MPQPLRILPLWLSLTGNAEKLVVSGSTGRVPQQSQPSGETGHFPGEPLALCL